MKKQKVEVVKAKLSYIEDICVAYNPLHGGDFSKYHPIYINFFVEESESESEDSVFSGRKTFQVQLRFHPLDVMHLLLLTDSHFEFENMRVPKDPYGTPFKKEYCDLDGRLVVEVDDMSKCNEAVLNLQAKAAKELEKARKLKEEEYKQADKKEGEVVSRWAQFL